MSEITRKFVLIVSLIVVSMLAGYAVRRYTRLNAAAMAEGLMTFVGVFGYTAVGFLSIWGLPVKTADFWLPAMAMVHVLVMCLLGLAAGRLITRDRAGVGLFSIAAGAGNNGFTMGGFIIYLLFGEPGLGLVTIYALAWTPMTVLLFYPIAKHHAGEGEPLDLGRLMLRNILDWRSIGLPITLLGLGLTLAGVPRPEAISTYHITDTLVYLVTPLAYFGIGLRLHVADVWALRRMLAGLGVMRFAVAAGVGALLVWATGLTPWPLLGRAADVFMIEAFVPTAVTMVAVANMFRLQPRQASVLFVVNTVMYLALVLPLVLWIWRQ